MGTTTRQTCHEDNHREPTAKATITTHPVVPILAPAAPTITPTQMGAITTPTTMEAPTTTAGKDLQRTPAQAVTSNVREYAYGREPTKILPLSTLHPAQPMIPQLGMCHCTAAPL